MASISTRRKPSPHRIGWTIENYIKRDVVKNFFDQILSPDDNRMDPQLMADAMVSIIPEDTGRFRNVVPKATEELARKIQRELY